MTERGAARAPAAPGCVAALLAATRRGRRCVRGSSPRGDARRKLLLLRRRHALRRPAQRSERRAAALGLDRRSMLRVFALVDTRSANVAGGGAGRAAVERRAAPSLSGHVNTGPPLAPARRPRGLVSDPQHRSASSTPGVGGLTVAAALAPRAAATSASSTSATPRGCPTAPSPPATVRALHPGQRRLSRRSAASRRWSSPATPPRRWRSTGWIAAQPRCRSGG